MKKVPVLSVPIEEFEPIDWIVKKFYKWIEK